MKLTLQFLEYVSGTLILISIVHYPKVQHHTIRMMHQLSDLTETQLRFEFRKFKYFVTEEVLPQVRRETMWIELLEGIPSKENEMIDLVKDGKCKYIQKCHFRHSEKGIPEPYD